MPQLYFKWSKLSIFDRFAYYERETDVGGTGEPLMFTKWFKQPIMDGVILFFGFIPFIFSLPIAGLILLYKGFLWLQSDKWPSFPLIKFLPKEFFNSDFGQWLIYPNSWKGLNKIIAWFFTTSIEWALIGFTFWFLVGCFFLDMYLQSVVEDRPEK